MALMKCPECKLNVSDQAISCPHCGYPIDKRVLRKNRSMSDSKRKRLPNGFGRITKLNDKKLRNPFRAMVTVGKDDFNKPIAKLLKPNAYFHTYNEAYEALVEYHKNPYDLDDDITLEQLYEKWSEQYFPQIEDSSVRTITSAWMYCSSVKHMRAKDIRARHIKGIMEDGYRIEYRGKNKGEKISATASTKGRIKSMFNLMLDYALEHEIVTMNNARTFDISNDIIKEREEAKRSHIPFSDSEFQKLWDSVNTTKYVDWVIIQCYMGWRPQELATLTLDEVNINEWYMQAGMKTDAGKQRIVPIHSKIQSLVKKNYDDAVSIGSQYLFNDIGKTHRSQKMTYDKYRNRFDSVISQLELNPEHRPHDPRNTFVTRGKKAKVDEYALKAMVGHSVKDITESTYTLRDVEWLRQDLEKIE